MKYEADYVVVGAGAVGMAFVDTLLTDTPDDVSVIMVDRGQQPGGHWNIAYPFVTLHQPSAYYGVESMELSQGTRDETGLNKGLSDLATGQQVRAYFNRVMDQRFVPSGRVTFLGGHDYQGDWQLQGTARDLATGQDVELVAKRAVVDATFLQANVPANHKPTFTVNEGVWFEPVNALPALTKAPQRYIIVGGGKTAIDAVLWLLDQGTEPQAIDWIMPRDGWLIPREITQNTQDYFELSMGTQAATFEAVAASSDIPDMFKRLEAAGALTRIDTQVTPQMFHAATVSQLELEQLRRLIPSIIRRGRIRRLSPGTITFVDSTEMTVDADTTLFVDCSARAILNDAVRPVFAGDRITLQCVRSHQLTFSASFIAHIEATMRDADEVVKNKYSAVVPLPNHDTDWIKMTAAFMMNQFNWGQDKALRDWMTQNRLDGFGKTLRERAKDDPIRIDAMVRIKKASFPAMGKLQDYMRELASNDTSNNKGEEMSQAQTLEVSRQSLGKTKIVNTPLTDLAPSEVRLRVDLFALTSNNVTYGVMGERLKYWDFFPAADGGVTQGVVPVWGFAEVVESKSDDIGVGERLYGYFPQGTHLTLKPNNVRNSTLMDASDHRAHLPGGYNMYFRVGNEPGYNQMFDAYRALLQPLYLTSFVIWDYLKDNDWFGASQVLVLSASSKTSIGTAYALQGDGDAPRSIGVTSAGNLALTEALGLYDTVMTYGQITELDASQKTVIVDMSGNAPVLKSLEDHLSASVTMALKVGMTHYDQGAAISHVFRENGEFFFAPTQIAKRMKEWGGAEFNKRSAGFITGAIQKSAAWMQVEEASGLEAVDSAWKATVRGEINPIKGLVFRA